MGNIVYSDVKSIKIHNTTSTSSTKWRGFFLNGVICRNSNNEFGTKKKKKCKKKKRSTLAEHLFTNPFPPHQPNTTQRWGIHNTSHMGSHTPL